MFIDSKKVEFAPVPFLKNGHLMTIAPAIWPRNLSHIKTASKQRLFQVSNDSHLLTHCHWQKNCQDSPTLIILHGLEGSADSLYILGLAHKAISLGFNVVRVNMRNCGGSMHLTPTLYNAGLSSDLLSVVNELQETDKLQSIFIAGFSLGGNIVLKALAELGDRVLGKITAIAAVSPSIDLNTAVEAIEHPKNRFYEKWFLRTLKDKIRMKAKTHPNLYDLKPLKTMDRIRHFDDIYTAPFGGYKNADDYYQRASALPIMNKIKIPTLVIAAEDDPIVPFVSFQSKEFNCAKLTFIATEFGGHAGFVQAEKESQPVFDEFWAENRILEFLVAVANS